MNFVISFAEISVNPQHGPDIGGTVITLTGKGMDEVISVSIASLPCTITRYLIALHA